MSDTEQTVVASPKKQKQIVVNVSAETKAKITKLKEELKLTDKEFVDVLLYLLANTDEATVSSAVETITSDKINAKYDAELAKLKERMQHLEALKNGGVEQENA